MPNCGTPTHSLNSFRACYTDKPLEADMPFANKAGQLTTADLRGQPTVLEYWAFT